MKKMNACVAEFFKIFDIYSRPVQLRFQQSPIFQTVLGGIISLILYIIFLGIFIYLYVDVSQKNNQQITTYYSRYANPPSYNLTYSLKEVDYENNQDQAYFFYSFAFIDSVKNIQLQKKQIDELFYLEVLLNERNKTTGITNVLKQYVMQECVQVLKSELETELANPLLNHSLCLNSSIVSVEGDFVSQIYRYLSVKIKKCSENKTATCKTDLEMTNAFSYIQVVFLYTDFKYNPSKKSGSPIDYVVNRLNVDMSSKIYQKFDFFISKLAFESYDDVYRFWAKTFEQPILSVNRINRSIAPPGKSIAAYYLRSEYNYKKSTRMYKSIIDLLAQIGGIWRVIFIIGAIVMVPLNKKLMQVAIANRLFNILPPDKDVERQTYKHYKNLSAAGDPDKIIKLNNKTPIECKMAIRYYKYERNRGMYFTLKEAFSAIFFVCFKPDSVKQKDRIFKESERRLMQKLSSSAILNFSKQINSLKKVILGRRALMVSYSHKYAIHCKKLKILRKKFDQFLENQNLENVDLALLKEVDFINGIRALKLKIGGLDEKIDINLLRLFNFKPRHLGKYFLNHFSTLENYFPNIKKHKNFLNLPENEEESEDK